MNVWSQEWFRRLVFILCSTLFSNALALTVILDTGQTESIAPFLEPLEKEDDGNVISAPVAPSVGAADPQSLLPILSPGLMAGPMKSRSHQRPFARPFFLVGSDPRSWQWLKTNAPRLKEIGAIGMLVQAETVGDLEAIVALANGLPILPASATDIGNALGITRYPVLISAGAIEQ